MAGSRMMSQKCQELSWPLTGKARLGMRDCDLSLQCGSALCIGRVKSRRCSMKRSTTGLMVRFFRVTTLTGQGRVGKSTGNILSDLKCATDLGIEVMNSPSARKWVMTAMDRVTTPALGMRMPRLGQIDE